MLLGALAQDDEIIVEGERSDTATSTTHLDRVAVESFPARSTDALLRAMPGLHQSAHGGHGKAYQYFVRGFDAVHGADLAVSLEGIPLNEVSNIHGHGYLDLHFVPSELVSGLDLVKGPGSPRVGDFGVAASADLGLGLSQEGLLVQVGGGTDLSAEATVAWRPHRSSAGNFALAQVEGGEGVGDSRAWRQAHLAAGGERWLGETHARTFALAYEGRFESPGVIREDDLDEIGFYGAYPESGGGRSRRLVLGVLAVRGQESGGWEVLAHGGARQLELRRNFTGYAQHPEHSDGVLQEHQALTSGLRARAWHRPVQALELRSGLDLRVDWIDQREAGIEPDGSEWEERIAAKATQVDGGLWGGVAWRPSSWLLLEPGLRADVVAIELSSEEASSWAPVACPRVLVVVDPHSALTAHASWGRGFRSPEVRSIGDGDRAPVSLADTAEVGLRWRPPSGAQVGLVGFHTAVSNELIFDHTAARFLASGSTRRLGGELVGSMPLRSWLRAEGELSWADGRYVATGEAIPFASRWLGSVGLFAQDEGRQGRFSAGLRTWVLGPRPLPEGFYSHPSAVVDLVAHAEHQGWVVDLSVDNALGSHWRDGEFVYASSFDPDSTASELPALHITAGEPSALRLALGRRFL